MFCLLIIIILIIIIFRNTEELFEGYPPMDCTNCGVNLKNGNCSDSCRMSKFTHSKFDLYKDNKILHRFQLPDYIDESTLDTKDTEVIDYKKVEDQIKLLEVDIPVDVSY
jgi:hypothetical protein